MAHLFDMSGFGYSGGVRRNCRIRDFIADLHKVVQQSYNDLPLYLYGHNIGALVGFYYLLLNKIKVAGVIFSSPLLAIPTSWKVTKLKTFMLHKFGTLVDVTHPAYPIGTHSELQHQPDHLIKG